MKCPRCQQENPPQAKFCLECAAPLPLRCANCGTQLPGEAKFCSECATAVGAPGFPPRFTPRRQDPHFEGTSPETYTPKRRFGGRAPTDHGPLRDLKGSMEGLTYWREPFFTG
jgi:hypothetical protein